MNLETPTDDFQDSDSNSESEPRPWVTRILIIVCIGIWFGLANQADRNSWESLSRFGCLPSESVWKGGYWALVTSALVHIDFWHVAFNMYWLSVLGGRLERAIGSVPYLVFFVVSAFVSSSFQVAVSSNTGIGASGVVYAIFGFMWAARDKCALFDEALSPRIIRLFFYGLIGCVVATQLNIFNVGNTAHISGLVFGVMVAGTFVLRSKPLFALGGATAMIVLAIVPLFWCPWSVSWLSYKAYDAHEKKQFDIAISRYSQIIKLAPDNAWAYSNRSLARQSIGEDEKAAADWKKACEIDPSLESKY